MIDRSLAHLGARLRPVAVLLFRLAARLAPQARRRRRRPLAIHGLSQHLRRDIGLDP